MQQDKCTVPRAEKDTRSVTPDILRSGGRLPRFTCRYVRMDIFRMQQAYIHVLLSPVA